MLKILFKTSAVHSQKPRLRGRVFYNLQAHMSRKQSVHFPSLCVSLCDWGCFCVGESGERNSKRESGLPYRLVVMVIKEGVLCERWRCRAIAAAFVLFLSLQEATLRSSVPSVPAPPFLSIPQHAQRFWIIELCAELLRFPPKLIRIERESCRRPCASSILLLTSHH